jgi:hypothetical protein
MRPALSKIFHPLVGVPCPNVGDLLDRADAEAREVLTVAARLAAWRIAQQDHVQALVTALSADPWSAKQPLVSLPPRALTADDVARAFFVVLPEWTEEVLSYRPTEPGRLAAQVQRWRSVAAQLELPFDRTLPLARPFARTWALTLARSTQPISTLQLLGHGATDGMLSINDDDLESTEVARVRLLHRVGEAAWRAHIHHSGVPHEHQAAYFDRHAGVAELERALARGPGAVVLGERGSGRRALVACVEAHIHRVAELRGFRFGDVWDSPWMNGDELLLPIGIGPQNVVTIRDFGRVLALEYQPMPMYRAWLATLEIMLQQCGGGDSLRVVIVATPQEHRLLLERVPMAAKLPVIHVPRPTPFERVAIWMCRVFELEQHAEGPVDLARLLWWMSRLPREQHVAASLAAPAPRSFAARLREARDGGTTPRRIAEVLERLELTRDELDALFEIEDALFARPRAG